MTYKESFIKFMVDSGVLTFGEFTLKSGRISPYFMNSGNYNTGAQLAKLGEFYAECIHDNGIDFETYFANSSGSDFRSFSLFTFCTLDSLTKSSKNCSLVQTSNKRINSFWINK